MHILIRSKGFPMTEAIDNYVRSRVNFILSRFGNVVKKVEAFVSDINGPKGGIDKACLVKIKTDQRSELIIKGLEADLYTAINRALSRAKQSLKRHTQQARKLRRNHLKSLPDDIAMELEPDLRPF